jgi:hypothetical protein
MPVVEAQHKMTDRNLPDSFSPRLSEADFQVCELSR